MPLTVREAARMLKMSERVMQERIEKGEIPSRGIHGRVFLNRDELVEWATARGLPVALPAGAGDEPMPVLSAALEAGGIVHGLPGRDKDAVLRHRDLQATLRACSKSSQRSSASSKPTDKRSSPLVTPPAARASGVSF